MTRLLLSRTSAGKSTWLSAPEGDIRLLAVATRFRQRLSEQVCFQRCREGVYEIQ